MPEVQRSDPPYLQVVKHIRTKITSGELQAGDAIPSARQLMRDWNISLATAAKVHTTLRAEGLVKGISGKGTIVTTQGLVLGARDRVIASRKGKIYPENEYARILSAELVPAPDEVADGLGISPGDPVLRRIRITYRDDDEHPVSASTSWFDGALVQRCPRLLSPERIQEGTPEYIAAVTSRTMTRGADQVTAAVATDEEAEALHLPPGSPVLRGCNRVFDQHDVVVEFGQFVSGPGRRRFYEYEV